MQKLYLILAAFTLSFLNPVFAQNWHYCHNRPSTANPLTMLGDSLILFSVKSEWLGCPEYETISLRPDGSVSWKSYGGILTKPTDSAIYLVDYNYEATDVPIRVPAILRLNNAGEKESHINTEVAVRDNSHVPPVNIDVSVRGEILVSSDFGIFVVRDTVYEYSYWPSDKPLIYNRTTEEEVLGAYFDNPIGEYYGFTIVFENKIARDYLPTDGTESIFEHPLDFEVDDHYFENNQLYIRDDSLIVLWEMNKEDWETIELNNYEHIIDFKVIDSTIWLLNYNDGFFFQTNDLTTEQQSASLPLEIPQLKTLVDFYIQDNQVLVCGTSITGQAVLFNFPLGTPAEISTTDIALIETEAEITETMLEDNLEGFIYSITTHFENTGTSLIDSVWLYTRLINGGVFCAAGEQQWLYKDLALAPGESVQLTEEYEIYSHFFMGSPALSDRCFELISPNSKIEANIENNTTCVDIVMKMENIYTEESVSVHPNPSSDYVSLSFNSPDSRNVAIYNTAGQMVYHENSDAENLTISVVGLSPGLYRIRIVEKDQTYSTALVVQ